MDLNQHEVYFIKQSRSIDLFHHTIHLAQKIKYFTFDTELNQFGNKPALIQIEFINEKIINSDHLPAHKQSLGF